MSSELPGKISDLTSLKKRKFLRLFIVLFASISLKGSPSSTSNWFLITFSLVTLFPNKNCYYILDFAFPAYDNYKWYVRFTELSIILLS